MNALYEDGNYIVAVEGTRVTQFVKTKVEYDVINGDYAINQLGKGRVLIKKAEIPNWDTDEVSAIPYSEATLIQFLRDKTAQCCDGGGGGSVPDASETVKGIAEIATQAETNTGTDDQRIVTPLKLKNRAINGEVHMQGNAIQTVIGAIDTPVKVAGATIVGLFTPNVTVGTNRLTYTGLEARRVGCHVSLTARKVGGGGGVDGTFYIAVNGVMIVKSSVQRQMTNQEGAIPMQCLLDLNENDYVELWVENNTNFQNFVIENFNLMICHND